MWSFKGIALLLVAPVLAALIFEGTILSIRVDKSDFVCPSPANNQVNPEGAILDLKERFGVACITEKNEIVSHGKDPGSLDVVPPIAVVYPSSTQDVKDIVMICKKNSVVLIPYGAGTSLENNAIPAVGVPSVSCDMKRMQRVLEVNLEDMFVRVESGLDRSALNEHLIRDNVFFPIDPGALKATIGGMISTGASGPFAVRYGTMRDAVMALEVVMSDGSIVRTGTLAPKSSSGYDLTHLFIGAEGTLGIVTSAVLRIQHEPRTKVGAIARFPDVPAAANAVQSLRLEDVPLAKIEFVNSASILGINRFFNKTYPEVPTLFLEFHASSVDVLMSQVVDMETRFVKGFDCQEFVPAWSDEEMKEMWFIRANAYYANAKLRGNKLAVTDTCVPVSNFSASIVATEEDFAQNSFLLAPIVGHVGDGNFHCMIPYDKNNRTEVDEVKRMYLRLLDRTLEMRGTITGEHGIGLGKKDYLIREKGVASVEMMRKIKCAVDPTELLNPGKVFDGGQCINQLGRDSMNGNFGRFGRFGSNGVCFFRSLVNKFVHDE